MKRTLTIAAFLFLVICPAFGNVISYSYTYQAGSSVPVPAQYFLMSTAPGQTFTLRSLQNGSLYTWLWPSLSNNTAPATLTISVSPIGLPPGTYQGSFAVDGAPYELTFVVYLTVSSQPFGVFSASPTALYFNADSGSSMTSTQSLFTFSTWMPLSYAVSTSASWLSVSTRVPSPYLPGTWTGFTPDQVYVTVNAYNLQPGTYYGFVQFAAISATNSPYNVPVTLYVRAAPPTALVVAPERLSFSGVAGHAIASQTLQVSVNNYNYASAYTTSIVSSDAWLVPELQSANAPYTMRVNISPGTLALGTYSGRIIITGPSWSGLSRIVPVDLIISPDDQPSITSLKDAASSFSFVSPGSWLAISGSNLASGVYRLAQPLPKSIDGTSVQIGGVPAQLSYVSPGQINAYVPTNLAGSTGRVSVLVQTSHGTATSAIDLHAVAPALFLSVDNHVAAVRTDGVVCAHERPAVTGGMVSIYGAGFGEVNDNAALPRTLAGEVRVYIGGRVATLHYAGVVGMGLYQFNVEVPSDLSSGEHAVAVELVGTPSNYTQGGVVLPVQSNQ